ncbi:MAG TPA: flagellar biosynthesis protein FliQ [Candidatus Acidoferrum sp.]|nr:flagellar biosynthesis protein FliQ [Candidatus Acidoferrum sp.]
MDTNIIMDIATNALKLLVYLAAPVLLAGLAVGLLVSVFQAATQIQEQTLSFIPKLIAMVVALMVMGPWMLQKWVDFTQNLFHSIPELIG